VRLPFAISGLPVLVGLACCLAAPPQAAGQKPSPGHAQTEEQETPGRDPIGREPMDRANAAPESNATSTSPSSQAAAPAGTAAARPSDAPPRISYADGELAVAADNCSLADVLTAIQNATGTKVEGMVDDNQDRVFGRFGPGAPRDILGALLAGSQYNYVVVADASNPGAARRVILLPRLEPPPEEPPMPEDAQATDAQATENRGATEPTGDPVPAPQQQEVPERQDQAAGQQTPGQQTSEPSAPVVPSSQNPPLQQNGQPNGPENGQQNPASQQPQPPRLPQHWGVNSTPPNNANPQPPPQP